MGLSFLKDSMHVAQRLLNPDLRPQTHLWKQPFCSQAFSPIWFRNHNNNSAVTILQFNENPRPCNPPIQTTWEMQMQADKTNWILLLLITLNSSVAYLKQITAGEESHRKLSQGSHHQCAHCNSETQNNFQGLPSFFYLQVNRVTRKN